MISIFLAGIRTRNWRSLYDSVLGSTSQPFEMIFVGPYDLPRNMTGVENVRYIKDYGCPSRCYQIGLVESRGDFVVWAADDGMFTANMSIEKAYSTLQDGNHKDLVAFKYFEGKKTKKSKKQEAKDWWKIGRHHLPRSCPYAPDDYYLVMNALVRREYMLDIGGWDCRFEHLGIGSVDLGIRLQNDGANVILGKRFMDISHLPGVEGDHAPIFYAQTQNDEPLFKQVYSDPSSQGRSRISLDNWKNAQSKWERRFK